MRVGVIACRCKRDERKPDARQIKPQAVIDFLPVLKGGDSLDHAVSWFKGGSH